MLPGLKKTGVNFGDVLMYVAIGLKHLRLIVLIACLCLLLGQFYYVFVRPVYYSRALVRVQSLPDQLDEQTIFNDSAIPTVIAQMTSATLIERAAVKLGIHQEFKEIEENLLKRIRINVSGDMLVVEVWAYRYNFAKDFPEALFREFIASREERRVKQRQLLLDSYSQSMDDISGILDQNAKKRSQFRDQQQVTQVLIEGKKTQSLPAELAQLERNIGDMEEICSKLKEPSLDLIAKLSILSTSENKASLSLGQVVDPADRKDSFSTGQMQANATNPGGIVIVPSMVAEQAWEPLEREKNQLEQRINEISRVYLPGHRKMVELEKQLQVLNQKLYSEYEMALHRFEVRYSSLVERRDSLRAKLPAYHENLDRMAKIDKENVLFESGQLSWKQIYGEMARKITAQEFAEDKERVILEFLGLAECKTKPVSPTRKRILLMSLGLAVVLGLGVPLLIEFLDHTATTIEQVEHAFQIRGLGIVPLVIRDSSAEPTLLHAADSQKDHLLENFRVIRTNLLSIGAISTAPQVLMVTSSMPKEGKTVVSSNLSLSFAQMGTRTLLIDADLRRGRIHRLLGMLKNPGLTGLLDDSVTLEEACRPTAIPNLHVLTAGSYHHETGIEKLSSQRFRQVVELLRSKYDRIIIDTPPTLGLSETSVMQSSTDGVLFVIWSAHTPMNTAKAAVNLLKKNGANFYGFVLNRLDLSSSTNYYQYYYYSNDYYRDYHSLKNA